MFLRASLMKMCHFVPIKISTYLVNWRAVNLLAAGKGLGRGIDIHSLMIETPKIFVGGMAIEHLVLVKIIKFKFRCWLGRKSCLMLIGGRVNDETTSRTCTLVVIPSTAASHIILDHKIKKQSNHKNHKSLFHFSLLYTKKQHQRVTLPFYHNPPLINE